MPLRQCATRVSPADPSATMGGKRKSGRDRQGAGEKRRRDGGYAEDAELEDPGRKDLYEVDSDAEEDARVQSRNRRALEDEDINFIAGTTKGEDSDLEIGEDEDEEIDSDEAFDSEDERKYGDFDFSRGGKAARGGGSESEDEDEESGSDWDSEEEEEDSEDEERHKEMLANLRQMRDESEQAEKEQRQRGAIAPKIQDESQEDALTLSDLVGSWKDSEGNLTSRKKKLEKSLQRMAPTAAPLPRVVQERNERKAAYTISSKDVSKWQNIVKANREARTLEFANRQATNLQVVSTTSGMADNVKPESEMEKQIAEMLGEERENAKAEEDQLPGNTLSKEELKERQAKLAKMRSVLFYQDQKAKRLKAIKSKRHHKYLKSVEKRRIEKEGIDMDPEAMKKEMEHAEYLRAKERLTLKHKNTSKWAKHALQRGFHRLDDNTKAALSEQNQLSEALKRKVNYQKESESEYSSSEEEEEEAEGAEGAAKRATALQKIDNKAKADVLRMLEEDPSAEVPDKGIFSLPFMKRAVAKQKEEAKQNAKDFLMELENDGLEDAPELSDGDKTAEGGSGDAGKIAFGGKRKIRRAEESREESESGTSGEGDEGDDEGDAAGPGENGSSRNGGAVTLNYGQTVLTSGRSREETFKASDLDVPDGKARSQSAKNGLESPSLTRKGKKKKAVVASEDDEEMSSEEDGEGLHLSQRQIVSQAFGAFGDDVQTDFHEEKARSMAEELPEFEEPADLPGWGKWEADKKTPKWILKARAKAEEQRKEALSSRKDRRLKHVVISERYDKKAAKYTTTSLPFPFKTREEYERSIRTPLGSDFNTDKSHRDLVRPEVLTTTGVRIDPLKFTKSNSHPKKEGTISGVRKV